MPAYRTPGVYFEYLDRSPVLRGRRTDIAGFVGIAERGPLYQSVRVDSWTQFTSVFGKHIPQGYLAYAVEGFFANGGQLCWVVRVADPASARPAWFDLEVDPGRPPIRLIASSPGIWGKDLKHMVTRTGQDRFVLTLRLPDGTWEQWRDLTLQPGDTRHIKTVLNDKTTGSLLVTAAEIGGIWPPPRDGLATLTPGHLLQGLVALETIDPVSIVAIPDIMPKPVSHPLTKPPAVHCDRLDVEPMLPVVNPAQLQRLQLTPLEFPPPFTETEIRELQRALIGHCECLRDRVAVLDAYIPDSTPEQIIAWRQYFDTSYAALYYPWLQVSDPWGLSGLLRAVPPSGHVAGIYARGDLQTGVHKPPANEILEGVMDVAYIVTTLDHGRLNDAGINVVRAFPGRGLRIAGARTLISPRNPRYQELRYVNVRRLLLMLEEAIDEDTQWTVFEPNNPVLWRELDRAARSLLQEFWQRGLLDGATAEEAFFVRCDETTNPAEETDQGRMLCLIGVQPPWPAEYVIVRLGKTEGGTGIVELNGVQYG